MSEARCNGVLRQMLEEYGPVLLRLAAGSISHGLTWGKPIHVDKATFAAELAADGACFVTLKHAGQLRGCVGSARAHRPLINDVAANAFAAAFADRRFPELKVAERQGLGLSVTVLSPPQPIAFTSEATLCAELRPYVDGLIIECDGRSAVFLPQVWEVLPAPRLFLGELKAKAGLAPHDWSPGFKAWRFVAQSVSSEVLDRPEALWL
jgi:MEMO1 family protein